ncbi:hypothetical protein GYMLUDRAFT_74715 [Collybiopsis luxurians FD-317 M1]|uniref:Uncharacterized protein n=1 Tax=Collybiopsis luxurians FD-317 M1 TaxID=944289 RepID=A0A0D0CKA4_9AGAR|nr:hypothetical protein GYMLUDRAFT_74715 [Collybiopsis luxurians FD-317 M1]
MVINSRSCNAVDGDGEPCMGRPIIKQCRTGLDPKGHQYFIACSGWTREWRQGHHSYSIPDNIDETVLVKLSNSIELDSIACIPTCT